jgi:hypothetical protein
VELLNARPKGMPRNAKSGMSRIKKQKPIIITMSSSPFENNTPIIKDAGGGCGAQRQLFFPLSDNYNSPKRTSYENSPVVWRQP